MDDTGCVTVVLQPFKSNQDLLSKCYIQFNGSLSLQIMIGEGILYCCLSKRRNGIGTEANINAGGCNFNSFLRRAVRFVGGFQLVLTKKNFPHTFSFHHTGETAFLNSSSAELSLA